MCQIVGVAYLWTSNIPGGTVIYHWSAGRDAGGVAELFSRRLHHQCDGYEAYPSWAKDKPHIVLVGCYAHLRRKFFEAQEQASKLVA